MKKNKRQRRPSRHDMSLKGASNNWFRFGWLALGLLLIVSSLSWVLYDNVRQRSARLRFFDAAVKATQTHGEVVFDQSNGTPHRLIIAFKQLHGGPSAINILQQEEKRELFFRHHEKLRALLQQQLPQLDTGMVHFFLEGFVGEKNEWPSDTDKVLSNTAMIDASLSDPAQRQVVWPVIERLFDGSMEDAQGALSVINAGGRFAAYCHRRGYSVVHGADPPGHRPLQELFYELIQALAEQKDPSDSEIQIVIDRIQAARSNDTLVRHRYLHKQMARVPEGGIGIILLGASHFGAGVSLEERATPHPLEQDLLSLPNARIVVVDETNLRKLLPLIAQDTLVAGGNMTPEHVRLYLKSMRKR